MADTEKVISGISHHLGDIFRHMLPGVLVVGTACLSYPSWIQKIDLKSWEHVLVLAVLTIAIGNAWFVLNRYGLHQLLDYVLYRWGIEGPAKAQNMPSNYRVDLGIHACKSLLAPDSASRAQHHVTFRASSVLLIFTIGELALIFGGVFHSTESVFVGKGIALGVAGFAVMLVGFWQKALTRQIDYFVVNSEHGNQQANIVQTSEGNPIDNDCSL